MTTPDTAAMRARLQATTRQPIETAPRDGSNILILTTYHGMVEAHFAPGEWTEHQEGREYSGAVWVCGDDAWQIEIEEFGEEGRKHGQEFHDGTATHWRPLPTAEHDADLAALLAAYDARGAEIERLRALATVPLLQTIERILDEHSAWIARPDHDVARAVALAAGIAGMEAARGAKSDYERHLEAQIAARHPTEDIS